MKLTRQVEVLCAAILLGGPALLYGQTPIGTALTYQGQLKQGGQPVDDPADFEFALWDAEVDGSDINDAIAVSNVQVTNGLFTVELDFETDIYSYDALWIEVKARFPAGAGEFTTLSPRQRLTPVPLALALPGLKTRQNATSPNVIGGWDQNSVSWGAVGATVAGGGAPLIGGNPRPNVVTDYYGTVSGGSGNRAGDNDATYDDADHATVGGGYANLASAAVSTVGGGWYNRATGDRATIAGGWNNFANKRGATVGGGRDNQATGTSSTVPGGYGNYASGDYSFAAGWQARASHNGAFVWADSINTIFESTAADQFLIRAGGGVGIGTASPSEQLTVNGIVESLTGGFKFPDGSVQATAGAGGDSVWDLNGANAYYSAGNVGIGYDSPNRKLYLLEDFEGVAYPLKLDNPHPVMGQDGVGILFSTGGSGGGPVSPTRGKGALVYEYTNTWNRGSLHFLQNPNTGEANPTLQDSVMTVTYNGKVGIGTTGPGQKLTVAGTIESTTGGFKFPDGTVQTTADIGASLPLPYEDSVSSNDPGFKITNTGNGHALYGESGGGDTDYGVYGIHTSTANRGWIGSSLGGVFGISGPPSSAQFGYLGRADAGVWGHASSANAWGGYFEGRGYFSGRVGIGVEPPANPLHVEGAGGVAGGYNQSEVVAHFKNTNSLYSAAAIDAESGKDSILYFSENGDAYWGIRHDVGTSHSLNIRYHGGPDKVNESIFRILADGTTRVRVLEIVGGADLAEPFAIEKSEKGAEMVEPGLVVVIDPDHPGRLKLAGDPYDRKVAGVISGAKGLKPGMVMKAEDKDLATGDHPVALTGRVWCRCDATGEAIRPGDLLTTSAKPGHAMKVTDYAKAQGAILGKAMTGLEEGTGLVLVLVTLQ